MFNLSGFTVACSSPQASPKVEASDRFKQAQPLSTCTKVQMETAESSRDSLIPGECVVSIALSDAYLHIPIHSNSKKYLRSFLFVVYEHHLDLALVKPTQERWLTSGFVLAL